VLQGATRPGSTFKIVVATAALEEGLVTPDFKVTCNGGANFFGRYFKCHLKGGHGTVDMRHAIEKSCNVYFYTLGNMLGVDKIHKWAEKLGLAGKTGIDLPNEQESLVPSTEWKMKRYGEKWYAGETISVSIGQGQVAVTPASLAVMISTVGQRRHPRDAARAEGDRRRAGLQAGAAPAVADHVAFKPDSVGAARRAVDGGERLGTGGRARLPRL
jgi:penicillin-binding protein 2